MNSTRNVNDRNIYIKNIDKSDKMARDDPVTESCLQDNYYNARQLNNGQTIQNRCSSLSSVFSRGSKRKGVLVVVMSIVLLAGVIAVCASFVMLGALGVQRMRIRDLESQVEALKAEIGLCKNETTSLSLELTACEKELQGTQHQMEINSAQCELEKGNLTASLQAEVRKGEHEREMAQGKLDACEGGKEELSRNMENQRRSAENEKEELSQRMETQRASAENEKAALEGRLDRCEQEQRELQRQQVADRVAANDRDAYRLASSQSRPSGAERVGSMKALFLLFSMLLPLLFWV